MDGSACDDDGLCPLDVPVITAPFELWHNDLTCRSIVHHLTRLSRLSFLRDPRQELLVNMSPGADTLLNFSCYFNPEALIEIHVVSEAVVAVGRLTCRTHPKGNRPMVMCIVPAPMSILVSPASTCTHCKNDKRNDGSVQILATLGSCNDETRGANNKATHGEDTEITSGTINPVIRPSI
jgi:hypothetical protein